MSLTRSALGLFVLLCAAGPALAAEPSSQPTSAPTKLIEDFDTTWDSANWTVWEGPEFPGAKGSFQRAKEAARSGQWGGRLDFDFHGGGAYVAAQRKLVGAPPLAAIRLWVKKPRGNPLTLRYTDPSGQTLQKPFGYVPDGRWVQLRVELAGWTTHWGGADNGIPQGPPVQLAILVENRGQPAGSVYLDDIEWIEGKPGPTTVSAEYPVGAWPEGLTWKFDFAGGQKSVGLLLPADSLLGRPQEIRIRYRGGAPGHTARLRMETHFMNLERRVGPFDAGQEPRELVVAAPPGEGWYWYGGENDGKLHGPLRLAKLYLDAGDRRDSGRIDLLEVRVKASCPAQRRCVLLADLRDSGGRREFVATARALSNEPIAAVLHWTVRDWAGTTLGTGSNELTLPAGAAPVEFALPVPGGDRSFVEAEFWLEAPGQVVPPAQAYWITPLRAESAHPGRLPESIFGVGLYLHRYPNTPEGLRQMGQAAELAQRAGVKWSREEFRWSNIERRKGELDWSFYDALVRTATDRGISIYGLLAYWADWTKPYTAEGIADYCRFAEAAAARYKDQIQHWEVWNEPNIFFWPGPPDMYAELLKQAYAAIKRGNPRAVVMGCSTSEIDERFIRRTMELGGRFDALTIHPYRDRLVDRTFIDELRNTAKLVQPPDGTPRPVWITEMGWGTHTAHNAVESDFIPSTQREQADLLARSYIDALASGDCRNISWYDFRNDGADPFYSEDNMGVVARDFRPKPAYRALATLTSLLEGRKVQKELDLGQSILAWQFASPDGKDPVTVLWSAEGDRDLALPATQPVELIDLMGDWWTLSPVDGRITLHLVQGSPQFLRP